MDKKLNTLYELCDMVYHDIDAANEKIKMSGGELSQGDVEYLQKLTSTMKNIKITIGMIEAEEEGYSGTYQDGRYYYDGMPTMERDNRSNRGRSMARGRSMGRGRYTRDDAHTDFMEEIEELIDKAPDEHTRKKFERFLAEMK